MAFWVHVEKGYTIFIVYFSSFKSLESLARLLEKVLKSCETFKIQDFANASLGAEMYYANISDEGALQFSSMCVDKDN